VGQFPERMMMYTKRAKLSAMAVSGAIMTQNVDCNSASDVPVAGACFVPSNAAAVAVSSNMFDWSDTSRPARWQCMFTNSGRDAVEVEAIITCKRTQ